MEQDEITITKQEVITYSRTVLEQEKQMLQDQLDIPEPSNEELKELGRMTHPYYMNKDGIRNRINEINEIIK